MKNNKTKAAMLKRLLDISAAVANFKDLDILLEKILSQAREIANADAGSIYIKEKNMLHFRVTQNDTLSKLLPPGKKLQYSYFSMEIDNSTISGYAANTGEILNIKDVYKIDKNAPYNFGKKYDEKTNYRTKSMLTIPLKTNIGQIAGVLQIINAKNASNKLIPFSKSLIPVMEYFANSATISIERAQMTREIILRMIKMAELRDPKETGAHVNRVGSYAVEIYEKWALKNKIDVLDIERNRDILRIAAMLHDVGKVGISDIILKKNAKFTPEEYDEMKKHTILGANLFGEMNSEVDVAASQIALNHHERWDGKGYPGYVDTFTGKPVEGRLLEDGRPAEKKEREIPLFARIVSIADVFDALASPRIYKEAWTEDEVLKAIKNGAGTQFDPELVDCFFETYDTIKSIKNRYE
ncbi:MAG TPA: HD domain-containing protein [bacterium]|nr:HD domain-containing protein [bacterium]HPN32179.1 HD domain-containing protein [bacterium]